MEASLCRHKIRYGNLRHFVYNVIREIMESRSRNGQNKDNPDAGMAIS